MTRSIDDVQRDLRELLRDPRPYDIEPQGPLADRPARHSSVLILFGALDRTIAQPSGRLADPEATSASAAPRAPDLPVPAELDVLLTRRADGMRHHPGQIAFPGGGAEPADDSPDRTALREAQEETGLDPDGVEVLGRLPEVLIPVSNNLVTPVVGWWRSPSEVAADHSESVDVFRTPVAELLDPASRGSSVLRRGGYTHRGPAFALHERFGGRVLWGFTGILLATMFDRLGWSVPWDAGREFEVLP
ncbi:NUDIX domain-containing protein [Leucobacter sp. gxy201]|uniref:NUDIX hydrolase n=1 Tax=Leucobacter sp. gxy201 TaxID=2957200 RepID=UPI003D9FCFD6